ERPADVGDLASPTAAEDVNLLAGETEMPQCSPLALELEERVELFQSGGVAETAEVALPSGHHEMHRLREDFHQLAGPELLLDQRGRESVGVVVAVFAVLGGELADRAVVEDRAARQHVVAVPREPVEDVLLFADGREPAVG